MASEDSVRLGRYTQATYGYLDTFVIPVCDCFWPEESLYLRPREGMYCLSTLICPSGDLKQE